MGGGEGEKKREKEWWGEEKTYKGREGGRGILGCCDAEARNFTL